MTPGEWAGFGAGVASVLSAVLLGLRFLVRSYLYELKINNGHSMKDSLIRLEKRVDDLFILLSKE